MLGRLHAIRTTAEGGKRQLIRNVCTNATEAARKCACQGPRHGGVADFVDRISLVFLARGSKLSPSDRLANRLLNG